MIASAVVLAAFIAAAAPQRPVAVDTTRLRWVPNPTQTTRGWVSDPSHHLAPRTVAAIDSTLFALEKATSVEAAVVVLDSLDGLTPADAALLLHRRWGVGKRGRDNGIVFLWSPALRKTYVSIGYRLEGVLTDARVGRVLDEAVLVRFRAGQFDEGVLAGVKALARIATADTAYVNQAAVRGPRPAVEAARPATSRAIPPDRALGVALLTLIALVVGLRWRRRRPRPCPNGHGPMRLLDESEDDANLSAEQRLEEKLASVDYDVWACAQCAASLVVPHDRWFSGYTRCPACRRRTAKSTSTTLVPATQVSEGLVEVRTRCANCGEDRAQKHVIPRLPAPSEKPGSGGGSFGGSDGGSSGGGGSSFGGGSAGGAGAGRGY